MDIGKKWTVHVVPSFEGLRGVVEGNKRKTAICGGPHSKTLETVGVYIPTIAVLRIVIIQIGSLPFF